MKHAPYFRINADTIGEYYVEIVDPAGAVLLRSKSYKSETTARNAVPILSSAGYCATHIFETELNSNPDNVPTKQRRKTRHKATTATR